MFEFEICYADKQANDAREKARFVHDERARGDFLIIARMWERLAVQYNDLDRATRAPTAAEALIA